MAEPFFPLTALTEAQRAQALERFTIIRPVLEEGVSRAQVARTSQIAPSTVQRLRSNAIERRAWQGWQITSHAQIKESLASCQRPRSS